VAGGGTLVHAARRQYSAAHVAAGKDDRRTAPYRLPGNGAAVAMSVGHSRAAPTLARPWMAGGGAAVDAAGEEAATDAAARVGNDFAGRHVARFARAAEAAGTLRQGGTVGHVDGTGRAPHQRATALLGPKPLLHAAEVDDGAAHDAVPTWVEASGRPDAGAVASLATLAGSTAVVPGRCDKGTQANATFELRPAK